MQPVVRALRILTAIARHSGGMGLQELADDLELPISTVHRLTRVLEDQGFLMRSSTTKHFLLGPATRLLATNMSLEYVLQVAEPEMQRLNRSTGETVFLAELVGNEVVCVAHVQGRQPVRLIVNVGTRLPLHAAASARVLLAALDEDRAKEILDGQDLTPYTPRTPTDIDQVLAHLKRVKEQGYDICDDEMEPSIWAAAAPLVDPRGDVRASLAVVAPLSNVSSEARREELVDALLTSTAKVSQILNPAQPS